MRQSSKKCKTGFIVSIVSLFLPVFIPGIIALVMCIKGIRECMPSTTNKWQGIVGIILSIWSVISSVVLAAVVVLPGIAAVGVGLQMKDAIESIPEQVVVETLNDTAEQLAEQVAEQESGGTSDESSDSTETGAEGESAEGEAAEGETGGSSDADADTVRAVPKSTSETSGSKNREAARTAQKVLTGEDEFGDLEASEDTKKASDTLPEIGEYEAYKYWGTFRKDIENGY